VAFIDTQRTCCTPSLFFYLRVRVELVETILDLLLTMGGAE
jgi:hypothetical protein